MDGAALRKAEEIFQLLADLPPEQHEAMLTERCGGDQDLRAFVESLLANHEAGMGTFMQTPVFTPPLDVVEPEPTLIPQRIGRYEIVRMIGEGGMGTVYLGRQEQPKRIVALKVIRPHLASRSMLKRFQHEAEILGQLHHPGIAHIYEAGMTELQTETGTSLRLPYFAMEYIEGDPLDQFVRKSRLGMRERLSLFASVCDAVQHAHQRGVIHRDLKPGNCLVDGTGQPKVLDFGVARATDGDMHTVTMVTTAGQILGTLAYMSPEQVTGDWRQLDTRSDIYSLGVILYELLTERSPVDVTSCSLLEAARRIRDDEPTRLTSVNRRFRGELDTIVSKAMDKEKTRRYQSAADLGADIRRYLRGDPIDARRDSAFYLLRKTVSRHRGFVAAATLFVLLLATFGLVSFIQAEANRRLAARESAAHLAAVAAKEYANQEAEKYRRSLYFSHIGYAQAALRDNDINRMKRLLSECPSDLRNWEWHYLLRLSDRSVATVESDMTELSCVAVSQDGTRMAASRFDGRVGLFDTRTLAPLCYHDLGLHHCIALSPDGNRILSNEGDHGRLVIRDALTGEQLHSRSHAANAGASAQTSYVRAVAYSRDGSLIASGDSPGTLCVWDAQLGTPLRCVDGEAGDIICTEFTPDNAMVVTGCADSKVRLWDIKTGALHRVFAGHHQDVAAVAVSPEGRLLASAGNDTRIRLWDLTTGEPLAVFTGHRFGVASVHFSPDATWLVSGGSDGVIKIWDVTTQRLVQSLRGHQDKVRFVTITSNGQEIISAGREGTFKRWLRLTRADIPTIPAGQRQTISVAFSPDGQRAASGGGDGTVKVWDVDTLGDIVTLTGHSRAVYAASFSPDGKHIVSGSADRTVRLWDGRTGALIRTYVGHAAGVRSATFDPDGVRIISADADGEVKVWDHHTAEELLSFRAHEDGAYCATFNHNGQRIVSGGRDDAVKIWDAGTGVLLSTLPRHQPIVYTVCYSPDDSRIAAVDGGGSVRIWDANDGRSVRAWAGHTGAALGVSYSPDGTRLVTGGADNTIRVWEAATGAEVLTLSGHQRLVQKVAFSPDGTCIASSSDDGTIRFWESAPSPSLRSAHPRSP